MRDMREHGVVIPTKHATKSPGRVVGERPITVEPTQNFLSGSEAAPVPSGGLQFICLPLSFFLSLEMILHRSPHSDNGKATAS